MIERILLIRHCIFIEIMMYQIIEQSIDTEISQLFVFMFLKMHQLVAINEKLLIRCMIWASTTKVVEEFKVARNIERCCWASFFLFRTVPLKGRRSSACREGRVSEGVGGLVSNTADLKLYHPAVLRGSPSPYPAIQRDEVGDELYDVILIIMLLRSWLHCLCSRFFWLELVIVDRNSNPLLPSP